MATTKLKNPETGKVQTFERKHAERLLKYQEAHTVPEKRFKEVNDEKRSDSDSGKRSSGGNS